MLQHEIEAPSLTKSQPQKRIIDPDSCMAIIQATKNNHSIRFEKYKKVQELYDRKPAVSEEELRLDGSGWSPCIDYGGMRRNIDDLTGAYDSLTFNVNTYCTPYSSHKPESGVNFSSIAANEFKTLLDDWGSYEIIANQQIFNRVAHGLGIYYWKDPESWKFESVHPINLIVPSNSTFDINSWSFFAISSDFDLVALIEKLENPEENEKLGWKIDNIKKTLIAIQEDELTSHQREEDYEEKILSGIMEDPLAFSARFSLKIPGYIYYEREYDGSITERLICNASEADDAPSLSAHKKKQLNMFLYEKVGRYEKMDQAIAIFPYAYGDGFIEKATGYGSQSAPEEDLKNFLKNHMLNLALLASSLYIRCDQESIDKMKEFTIRPITLVPEGVQLEQQSLSQKPTMELAQTFDFILQDGFSRNNYAGGSQESLPRNTRTAAEANIRYRQASQSRSNVYRVYYSQLSKFYLLLWKKIINSSDQDAKDFIKKLKDQGIDRKSINDVYRCPATKAFGDGDPAQQFLILSQLMPFFGTLQESERNRFIRTAFETGGYDFSKYILNDESVTDDKERLEIQVASYENSMLSSAPQILIPVTGMENHAIHLEIHLPQGESIVNQFLSQQINPQIAVIQTSAILQHSKPHLDLLSQDQFRKNEFLILRQRYNNIENQNRAMAQNAQEQNEKIAAQQRQRLAIEIQQAEQELQRKAQELSIKEESLNVKQENLRLEQEMLEKNKAEAAANDESILPIPSIEDILLSQEQNSTSTPFTQSSTPSTF